MKVRLEAQKTIIRLSKMEFQELLEKKALASETIFPDGNKIKFCLELGNNTALAFRDNELHFVLPIRKVKEHKPSKSGLSFIFQSDNCPYHQVVFEVDIKKSPLGSRKKLN